MVLNIDIVKCLGKVTKNPTLQEKNGKIFFKKNHLAQTLDFVQEKAGQNIIGQGFSARSDFLLCSVGFAIRSARSDLQSDRYKYEHLKCGKRKSESGL